MAVFLSKRKEAKETHAAAPIQQAIESTPAANILQNAVEDEPPAALTQNDVRERVRNRRCVTAASTETSSASVVACSATTSDQQVCQNVPEAITVVEIASQCEGEQEITCGPLAIEVEVTTESSTPNETRPSLPNFVVDPQSQEKKKELDPGVSFAPWRLIPIDIPLPAYRRLTAAPRPTHSRSKAASQPVYNRSTTAERAPWIFSVPTVTYIPTPKAELIRRRREEAARARALLRPVEEIEDIFATG
uniref:Uncharacterized protein n=1 Tax=Trichogramma kaykai TaxID=54128 RepID=A0ABD2X1F2_9HYME